MHRGASYIETGCSVVIVTSHQYLNVQNVVISKDCLLQEKDPSRLVKLLIVICVSAELTKQM